MVNQRVLLAYNIHHCIHCLLLYLSDAGEERKNASKSVTHKTGFNKSSAIDLTLSTIDFEGRFFSPMYWSANFPFSVSRVQYMLV
jgi:hypothetical protein